MKYSAALLVLLGLAAVAQALPSSSFRLARQEEAAAPAAEAAAAPVPAAEAGESGAPAETGVAVAEAEKHGHHHEHEHETKPEVHPHPLNWYLIYNAAKALAPVVGGLIEPLMVNIVHGIVGAVIQTINTGFSLPVPHHYPSHYSHKEPHGHGHQPHHE